MYVLKEGDELWQLVILSDEKQVHCRWFGQMLLLQLECASNSIEEHAPRALRMCGPIAQSVEQLAFNQWVAGSSPARLKSHLAHLDQSSSHP